MIERQPDDRRIKTSIRNRIEDLGQLHETARTFAQREGLSSDARAAIGLVLEEIVSNVIRHGFDGSDDHTIDVEIAMRAGEVVVTVADDGRPFNPVADAQPDTDEPAAGRLGLELVREVAQTLDYRRENGRNRLNVHLGVPVE